jgi:hypothetical protein
MNQATSAEYWAIIVCWLNSLQGGSGYPPLSSILSSVTHTDAFGQGKPLNWFKTVRKIRTKKVPAICFRKWDWYRHNALYQANCDLTPTNSGYSAWYSIPRGLARYSLLMAFQCTFYLILMAWPGTPFPWLCIIPLLDTSCRRQR